MIVRGLTRRQTIALAALGIAWRPARAAAQATSVATLTVGVIPGIPSAELFYGIDNGMFRAHGIEVQVQTLGNGPAIGAAVASGALDIGLSDMMSVIGAHARGVPFVFLAQGQVVSYKAPGFGIIVGGNSDIRTARDFNGTTMAVSALKSISQVPVQAWIDRNGGDSKTMHFIEVPIPQMGALVGAGTVQSAVPAEPFLTAAVDAGARAILMDHNALAPAFPLSGWVTTTDWYQKNGDRADRFIAALHDAAVWANHNPEAATVILAKYTKISPDVARRILPFAFAETNHPELVQPLIDAAVRYGVIAKSFPAQDILVGKR